VGEDLEQSIAKFHHLFWWVSLEHHGVVVGLWRVCGQGGGVCREEVRTAVDLGTHAFKERRLLAGVLLAVISI